jgi:hypothetical protein
LQRWVAYPMVEQEGNCVREDFAHQPAGKMPEVPGPHSLYGVTLHKLRKDGVDAVAKTAQIGACFGMGVSAFVLVGCDELDAYCGQLFLGLGRVVVAVPDQKAGGSLEEFGEDAELVGVGWSYRDTANDPWPADPRVHPEAVEGLFEERVLSESSLPAESTATVGSREGARRQGQRVRQSEGRVVGSEGEKLLPESFLDLPEVGCLPREGGAVDDPERREPLTVVPSEEEVDTLVGVEPQELAHDLYGEDLGVGKLRSGATPTDTPSFELIVYEAEDGDDEGAKIHESEDLLLASVGLGTTERREVSLFIQPFGETCTRG